MIDKKQDYLERLVDSISDTIITIFPEVINIDLGYPESGIVDRNVRNVVYSTSRALIDTERRLSEMMDARYGELEGFRVVTDDD